jgi:L-aspartate oxidase
MITKGKLMDSNSSKAQGGIAAVMSPPDTFSKHIKDTLKVGQGLSDKEAVETLVEHGPAQIEWLIEQGVEFSRNDGKLDLTREGGHSSRRVVHAGDITGFEVQKVLVKNLRGNENIRVYEETTAIDLILRSGRCVGVKSLDKSSKIVEFYADTVVLATGGVGQLYSKTSNPVVATCDGVAMAWRAGAVLRDIEFIQFHPTVLNIGESPFFLISEAVRGEGGVLINSEKEAFMTRYHPMQDLAPRDIVSRAIVEEQKKGPVYLDIRDRGREFLSTRFAGIYKECLEKGIKMDEDLIPVSPAAHYFCGGVKSTQYCDTNIEGLLVIGESACTGVHGANRMASNSLLECLVFSEMAVKNITENKNFPEIVTGDSIICHDDDKALRQQIQDTMWRSVGINRESTELQKATLMLDKIYRETSDRIENNLSVQSIENYNLTTVARLVARAAHLRTESRGTQMLNDHPTRDDKNWLKHIEFKKENVTLVDHK